jgi:putative DNA primase/helicase
MDKVLDFYFAAGLLVVPTRADKKAPVARWKDVATEAQARALWEGRAHARFGVLTGPSRVLVVDVDLKDDDGGWRSLVAWVADQEGVGLDDATAMLDAHPVQCVTWSGGRHLYFRLEDADDWPAVPTTRAAVLPSVDLRGRGGFVVAPPSTFNGGRYQWQGRWSSRDEIPFVPLWLHELVRAGAGAMVADSDSQDEEAPTSPAAKGFDRAVAAEHHLRNALAKAAVGSRNETGFKLANQLRDLGLPEGEALPYMERFAAGVPKAGTRDDYDAEEAAGTLKGAYRYAPREPAVPRDSLPSPFPPPPTDEDRPWPDEGAEGPPPDEGQLRKPREDRRLAPDEVPADLAGEDLMMYLAALELNDEGNALAYQRVAGEDFRFDRVRDRWFRWAGHAWRECLGSAPDRAMVDAVCRRAQAAGYIMDDDFRKKVVAFCVSSKNRLRVVNGLKQAATLPALEWPADLALDADPWLLGCENGVLDLRAGALRPGARGDLVTRGTNLPYDPAACCPRWERFLDEVFLGDRQLVDFVRRAAGYSLTGSTREQVLFLLHGKGANGKSVFLGALFGVLGDYAGQTPFSTFEVAVGDRQSNDLAALRGRRLVVASEATDGRRFDEARIKAITGGDRITARFLMKEFFTYAPSFKIWLAMNYRPHIRGTDDGIWRRIRLVPFDASFVGAKADPDLPQTLRAESPGILAWAVRGAREWLAGGLQPPRVVLEATDAYRKESDVVGQFLVEETVQRPGVVTQAKDLYDRYRKWCEARGEKYVTGTKFGRTLAERGFQKDRSSGRVKYVGLGLAAEEG